MLRHHPDKKAAAGSSEDDSFFKCIQKATEILLDPVKRRQFDSVDENADVEPPSKKETQRGNFYKLWKPVFDSEARFSKTQPVPGLGDENSSKEEVETFYNFWYNFDSWRTFEYQDEDVPDDNENRDQKRYIERKNNAARKKKKTEDTARLRKLVDDALGYDERIKKFRQQERASKDRRKVEKEAESKRLADEAARAKAVEDRQRREAEESAKIERVHDKKAKEAAKNAVKKNKRVLKATVKEVNYFSSDPSLPPSAAVVDSVLDDLDLLVAHLDPDQLAALVLKLQHLNHDVDAVKAVYRQEVLRLVDDGRLKPGQLQTFSD